LGIYSRNKKVGSMGVGVGLYMYDLVVKKFTFAISSPDEFLSISLRKGRKVSWHAILVIGLLQDGIPISVLTWLNIQ